MNILQARSSVTAASMSSAMAARCTGTHWVADFNKTVFSHNLSEQQRRFQASACPHRGRTHRVGKRHRIRHGVCRASRELHSGNRCADRDIELGQLGKHYSRCRSRALHQVPVIGISGFDGGRLNLLSDAKILIATLKANTNWLKEFTPWSFTYSQSISKITSATFIIGESMQRRRPRRP